MTSASCAWCNLWCGLSDLWCCLQDSNLFTLLLALSVAFVLIWNLYSGFLLCQQSAERAANLATSTTANRSTANSTANSTACSAASSTACSTACSAASSAASLTASCTATPTPTAAASPGIYDYGLVHGPHTWNTASNNQSPINIDTRCVQTKCFDSQLMWMNYENLPAGIRIENMGHTLVLRAAFHAPMPYIDGGDLLGRFDFQEISFRWSWYNATGSEHTINNVHCPLEMQCMHINDNNQLPSGRTSSRGILMISYLFELSGDNPYLDVLIQHLVAVQQAGACVEIPPFPLRYLMPPFYTDFYSYHGSLTEPPCHRGAEWFVYPVPLAIGERQLYEFRQLRAKSGGRIGCNARPVQELCHRDVYCNQYSGARRRRCTRIN